jgi:hypothetical protein
MLLKLPTTQIRLRITGNGGASQVDGVDTHVALIVPLPPVGAKTH